MNANVFEARGSSQAVLWRVRARVSWQGTGGSTVALTASAMPLRLLLGRPRHGALDRGRFRPWSGRMEEEPRWDHVVLGCPRASKRGVQGGPGLTPLCPRAGLGQDRADEVYE